MNLSKVFVSMFIDPVKGFSEALAAKPWTLLVPLIGVIGCTVLVNGYYYMHVDFAWLTVQLQDGADAKQREAIARAVSPERMFIISLIGVTLLTAGVDALRSMFFWLVLKIKGQPLGYRKLFAITTWAAVPLTLLLPAAVLNLTLSGGGHVAPNDVNPVSLNQLFFHLPSAHGWGNMLSTISLVSIWEVILLVIGLKTMASVSTKGAVLLAVIPDIVIYGIWMAVLAGTAHT